MFGLIKTPIKESPPPADTLSFSDLHPGCVLGFGFMPQKSISGRRVPVIEVNSYIFDADSFIAYRLEGDSITNLIVADEGDPMGTYLALSLKIEPRLFDMLFPDNPPEDWFALEEEDEVGAKPIVLGMPPGWLTTRYTLAVSTKGRYLEGDYRMRKPTDRTRLSRPFDYVLLVDEDNDYAIEAERYEDGTMNVFATVYRPATDIGEIARSPRAGFASVEIIPHVAPEALKDTAPEAAVEAKVEPVIETPTPPEPEKPAEKIAEIVPAAEREEEAPATETARREEPPVPETEKPAADDALSIIALPDIAVVQSEEKPQSEQKPEPEVKPAFEEKAKSEENPEPEKIISLSETPPAEPALVSLPEKTGVEMVMLLPDVVVSDAAVHSKFGRIQTAGMPERQGAQGMLACDLHLAGRLIDEAQRNQMLLSELIRKVIDLPARVKEEVFIPFTLDNAEQAELARRYNLPVTDTEGVKGQVVEELLRFLGEKK